MVTPNQPTKYRGTDVYLVSTVVRDRRPTGADYRQPETGKLYPVWATWQVGKNPTNGAEGELWILQKIVANVAYWIPISTGSSGPVLSLSDTSDVLVYPTALGNIQLRGSVGIVITSDPPDNRLDFTLPGGGTAIENVTVDAVTAPGVNPVTPTSLGNMTLHGAIVAAHSVPIETRSRALHNINVEVQYAAAVAATDGTKCGMSHYLSSQFDVDSVGFVTLKGSVNPAITGVNVDAHTAPGTDPVLADASGLITVTGAQVAAGTVGANVIRTDSLAANTYTIEVQRSDENATSDSSKNGVCHFDSAAFTVDANGWVQLIGGSGANTFSNLGIAYSGGTFTVCSASGAALSSSNAATIWLQDKSTPGQMKKYTVTANQTFTDGTGGQTAGADFGITTTRYDGTATSNWSEDLPMYLYAVGNDSQDTIAFMISRNPAAKTSPAAASISKQGSIINVDRYDFYCLPDVTVADYDSNPCVNVGAFRVRTTINASHNCITVQSLTTADGIGQYHEATLFLMPAGVNGSGSGNYFQNNGGTLGPTFTSSLVRYCLKKTGFVAMNFEMNGVSANGTGANVLKATLPFGCATGWGTDSIFTYYSNGGTAVVTYFTGSQNGNENFIYQFGLAGSAAKVNQNGFAAGDEFGFRTSYQAFNDA